jgi:hypothetical protein
MAPDPVNSSPILTGSAATLVRRFVPNRAWRPIHDASSSCCPL